MLIRALVILLLVLNAGIALWWALHTPAPASAAADQAPGVEMLQLVATHGDSTVSQPSENDIEAKIEQCASFGSFPSASAAHAAGRQLQAEGIETGNQRAGVVASTVRQSHAGSPRSWRVMLPALPSAEESAAVAKRIAATGFRDYYVIRDGADANAIALGLFGNEASAHQRAATLVKDGFGAVVLPVGAGKVEHWLDIAAAAAFEAKLLGIKLGVPRTEDLDCAAFSADFQAAATDLGHNSAAH